MKFGGVFLSLSLAACTTGEWVRDYDGWVPNTNPPSVYAVLVVDALTGRPIPGARMTLYREDIRPEGLPGHFVIGAEADELGVVSIEWRDEYAGCHFIFDHPGYAPVDNFGAVEELIQLQRGRHLSGLLYDSQGRPAGGVAVEFYLGCPHSPALRRARTDARGRFVLRDASDDGTIWAPAAGCTAQYWSTILLPVAGDVLEPIRPAPGITVTGTVYDEKGGPAAGAVVYSTQEVRGPKTVTRKDGTFTLHGVAPGAEVSFQGARASMQRTKPPDAPPPRPPPPENQLRVRPPGDLDKYRFRVGLGGDAETWMHDYADVRTTLRGPVRVSFDHEDFGEGEVVVDVVGRTVDVGPEAFPIPGVIKVVGPDGRLLESGATVAVSRDGGPWMWVDAERSVFTDWRFQPGARLRVSRDDRREGHKSCYRTLEGAGPYRGEGFGSHLMWTDRGEETGQGERRVYDQDGTFSTEKGPPSGESRLVIRGLDAGAHTLLVGAVGRRGRVLRVVLENNETRRIDLRLDPR
jgi:hypothetical protein